jgi:hypothetical protein
MKPIHASCRLKGLAIITQALGSEKWRSDHGASLYLQQVSSLGQSWDPNFSRELS